MGKIHIIGMGNPIRGDDGFGVHLIDELARSPLPPSVNLINSVNADCLFIPGIEPDDVIIVLDTLSSGKPPGSIVKFNYSDIACNDFSPISLGQVNILNTITPLTSKIDPSRITIIGVEPKNLSFAIGLSPEIQEKIPSILRLINDEINKYIL